MAHSFYLETDPVHWNKLVNEASHAHIMQTWEWGEYKSHLGWHPIRLAIRNGHSIVAGAQILFRSIPLTPWTIGYIPKGPLISLQSTPKWDCLLEGFRESAQHFRSILIRIEPSYLNTPEAKMTLAGFRFRLTQQTNQPRCTLMIDLSDGESATFERFSRNTKRLIRKAEREGVTIEEGGIDSMEFFYKQLNDTARRKKLPVQNRHFFTEAYRKFKSTQRVALYHAKYQEQLVSSLIVFYYKDFSMHIWAGNSLLGLKSNASHLLHWTAMRMAINRGCQTCDLWGIPDEIADMTDEGINISRERSDGLWGVYRFKEGFGGAIQCYAGTYDYIYKPKLYGLMRFLMSGQRTVDRISSILHRF